MIDENSKARVFHFDISVLHSFLFLFSLSSILFLSFSLYFLLGLKFSLPSRRKLYGESEGISVGIGGDLLGFPKMSFDPVPSNSHYNLDEQIAQLMQCKPLSEQEVSCFLFFSRIESCYLYFELFWIH